MGYSHFDDNEQDIMRIALKEPILKDIRKDYPFHIDSLIRKKMLVKDNGFYIITERGKNAITQQLRSGEYWLSPLKPKKFNLFPKAKIKLPKEYKTYLR